MSYNEPALFEMKNISFSSNGITVIEDLTLTVHSGTITAFLGEPGGGKSSALKLLAGIISPTKGNLFYNGKNVHLMTIKENENFRKKMGFMFQDSALWQNQDVYHNLELPLQIHFPEMSPEERKERILEVFNLVGCEKPITFRPAGLSIGEQKMIGFARAIICKPDILFLDEPTESLDERTVNIITSLLKDFCYKENKTLIYVSHDADFIKTFNGNKYFLDSGVVSKTEIISTNNQKSEENDPG
ncbi:MAG: ATP-binding cassette domain-containing protein [Treponema sp.]|nr:ATP-binding cassette domain-containing protein [Treponema sp.]